MKKMFAVAMVFACLGFVGVDAQAQMNGMSMPAQKPGEPLPSPRHEVNVALTKANVHISYGAPSMRGRRIMGELVPYTMWWRTGANEATTFEVTGGDVMVGKLKIPPGKYTLVTLPSAGEWQLVICKHTGQWGTERFPADDLGKTPMFKKTLGTPQELMSITFENTKGKDTQLHVKWETTDVYVPIMSM